MLWGLRCSMMQQQNSASLEWHEILHRWNDRARTFAQTAGLQPWSYCVCRQHWKLASHIANLPEHRLVRRILAWNPSVRYRSLGRRPHTWDYQLQAFCRYKDLGPWLEEAKHHHHWNALFEDFYSFCHMWEQFEISCETNVHISFHRLCPKWARLVAYRHWPLTIATTKLVEVVCKLPPRKFTVADSQTHWTDSAYFVTDAGFLLITSGQEDEAYAGVGFLVAPHCRRSVVSFCQFSGRQASLKMRVPGGKMVVCSRLIKANHLKRGFNFTKVQVNGLANYLGMGHYWCLATSMQGYTLGLLLKSIGWANISLDTFQPNLIQSQTDNFC